MQVEDDRKCRDQVDRVFRKLDLNQDGVITIEEFIESCLKVSSVRNGVTMQVKCYIGGMRLICFKEPKTVSINGGPSRLSVALPLVWLYPISPSSLACVHNSHREIAALSGPAFDGQMKQNIAKTGSRKLVS